MIGVAAAREHQRGGAIAFLRACRACVRLEYRSLRYYPSNLGLAAVQELTTVAVWYFVARFLGGTVEADVRAYGGHYLAFVVLGVLLNQVATTALTGPFTIISEAFCDKRLETYRLAIHGIWANVVGRLLWQIAFSSALQGVALAVLVATGAIAIDAGARLGLALAVCLLVVAANAGIGIAGASLCFLLEVKSGQDPITWAYRYLVMLASGLYVPVALLPGWLHAVGRVLPQTYAFAAVRAIVLTGAGWSNPNAGPNVLGLVVGTLLAVGIGVAVLSLALRHTEQRGGMGVVV